MALDQRKYERAHTDILRDIRPMGMRVADTVSRPSYSSAIFGTAAMLVYFFPWATALSDLILFGMLLYFWWLRRRDRSLAFKLPMGAKYKDKNNEGPGRSGQAEGILYLGNTDRTDEEVWFTNSDIRTHILYLGTTGAGKTEGLKSLVTNAMAWGSGFVYIDGKADTDLWSSLSALVRRFGRDDDLLVLNYMTGNSDVSAPSNTMNPFSSGSASYLVNMLVSLMPESEGDNAMWKERAVALISAMMPILTWKRDHQEMPLSVTIIRDYLALPNVIKLGRDEAVPAKLREGIDGYLDTLPGFIAEAYDDEGKVKPPGPDTPQYDTTTASQQHGYLAMQFTRSLQSLGDDYGYIFDTQAADVDMVDVVLNRRILVVLIPALEKSGDEIANLGKIVSATLKGMMGSALGTTVEGESSTVIENKPTHSSTPFMTVFDEVGYYAAQGMAVMAAQARSLGFCLVFAGQDLPAMKKRVREEAQSITANCNIKIFGKLEDPTETKDFFEKTVGSAIVTEVSGFQMVGGSEFGSYFDTQQAGVQLRPRASYDGLRQFKEGQAVVTFGETVVDCQIFYSNPGFAKAMRVTRYVALPKPDDQLMKHAAAITKLRDRMMSKSWSAERADVAVETAPEIAALAKGYAAVDRDDVSAVDKGICALVEVYAINNPVEPLAKKPEVKAEAPAKAAAEEPPPQQQPVKAPKAEKPEKSEKSEESKPDEASDQAVQDEERKGDSSGGPMGFFSDKKSESQPDAPRETPPAKAAEDTPVAKKAAEPTPQSQPEPSVLPRDPMLKDAPKLPSEIMSILSEAAQAARRALFREEEHDD